MGFKINLTPHSRAAGRFIGQVRRDLVKAVEEATSKYGKTRSDMARNIGCDKAVITRKLSGKADLTLRSIAEIAYESNTRPKIVFEKAHIVKEGSNQASTNPNEHMHELDAHHSAQTQSTTVMVQVA
ncbi:hypothetical protein [Thalassospira sp. MCCC 1A03138]|uniref:hypothetical protein n=1 Tax=Thalassospira sp. MCCC 1A03138 TaxID=1470576 RepID=UPI000A1D7A32|nr:hypothetical protein [Thalassospira sp. MCCC 1A03138]OSQ30274.1 hypothetical protein TH468_12560 [Thalassospira sp. MCCC 1A03138]